MTEKSQRPLEGIRVLDLSRILAGPVCTQILADLGADVVKVERPGTGDDTREWGPPFLPPAEGQSRGESAYFLSCNRGKRGLTLDMQSPEGRALLEKLIRRADVLVENFLPAQAARFGLSPERLAELNPRLVSCSISAFGRNSPMASVPGYDLMIQAASGLMSLNGEPDGRPMKVGVAITDVITGLYAAVSALAGLVSRERIGARAFDLALFDCTLASLVNVAQGTLVSGQPPVRYGNAHPNIVPYEVFATADSYIALAIGADRQWQRFCQEENRDEWAADPRFATNPARVRHRGELIPLLEQHLRSRSTAEWLARLEKIDVPHAAVTPLDEALDSAAASARDMVQSVTDAHGRTYRLLGSPIHWQNEPPRVHQPPPLLGQHNQEVMRDWLGEGEEMMSAE